MKKKIITLLIITAVSFVFWFSVKEILAYQDKSSERALLQAQNQTLENTINSRINARRIKDSTTQEIVDPFGEDNILRMLFIGIDARIGENNGHCDAIQLITINNKTETIDITAVPRGTYSPLPPGKGTTSTDYYVSNACGLGGLDYGIKQIEKILGVKADYLVMVGFSEALGIMRNLHLPTTETLQWLRNRHGYAIGEPQRAHNHSGFIKQMMIKFVPTKKSKLDLPLQYLVYRLVKTDLSFAQAQKVVDAISAMDIANHPEKITLSMRPLFPVQDIAYDPERLDENLDQTLGAIKNNLAKDDYSGVPMETVQTKLLATIENNKNNPDFVTWAYTNNLWLQIEDNEKRLSVQYDLLNYYLTTLSDKQEREATLADYIIEMENRGETLWQEKAKKLLGEEIKK